MVIYQPLNFWWSVVVLCHLTPYDPSLYPWMYTTWGQGGGGEKYVSQLGKCRYYAAAGKVL